MLITYQIEHYTYTYQKIDDNRSTMLSDATLDLPKSRSGGVGDGGADTSRRPHARTYAHVHGVRVCVCVVTQCVCALRPDS